MKIIAGKYPEEKDIDKYLSFVSKESSHCSLVFLWRLAALARDIGHNMTGIGGRRDAKKQQQLWDADLKAHGGIPSGKVARPNTSWHEPGCATDLDGEYWKAYSNKNWVPYSRFNQKQLAKYGLMLPLNKVDSPSVIEWWHLQPIETNGIASNKRKDFLDKDDLIYGEDGGGMEVTEFQAAMGLTADGIAGPQTKAKAIEVMQCCQQILGLNFTTPEEAIKACMTKPKQWLEKLETIDYFPAFIMNIVKKMGGRA